MHPVLAQFLDLRHSQKTLDTALEATPTNEAAVYCKVAARHPDKKATLLSEKASSHPSTDTQQALLFLATHAALESLSQDAVFGPKVAHARSILAEEGASEEESEFLLASVLLEEAFGFLNENEHFDEDIVAETLDTVAVWGRLTEQWVAECLEALSESAALDLKPTVSEASEVLFSVAFGEGPGPITVEHVETALSELVGSLGSTEKPKAVPALMHVLSHLHQQGVIGPLRHERLTEAVSDLPSEEAPDGLAN